MQWANVQSMQSMLRKKRKKNSNFTVSIVLHNLQSSQTMVIFLTKKNDLTFPIITNLKALVNTSSFELSLPKY